MINFQLSYLKYTASEHPEDLVSLFDGKFKENLMEATVQLLFQDEYQPKDSQSVIKRSNVENLDLPPSSYLLNSSDMDLVPEIIGLYEDNSRVIEAIKSMKYKKLGPAGSSKEDNINVERSPYEKSKEDLNRSRKEDTPRSSNEEQKMETEDKPKAGLASAYPEYSQGSKAYHHSNMTLPQQDMRRTYESNNQDMNKRFGNMPFHTGAMNYGGDRSNMTNYENYQQANLMGYNQNFNNYSSGKPGAFNNGTVFPYASQAHSSPNYGTLPNYSAPMANYNMPHSSYYPNYPNYSNPQYQVIEPNAMTTDDSSYRSGNNHAQSNKSSKSDKIQDNKQKHFDKSAR